MRRSIALVCLVAALFGGTAGAEAQPEADIRVAIVVGVSGRPFLGPDDEPLADQRPRLAELADGLERFVDLGRRVPFALDVSPLYVDELLRLSRSDAARAHTALVALATAAPVLQAPYAAVRLTDLEPGDIESSIDRGRRFVETDLRTTPIGVIAPPALALDEQTFDALPPGSVLAGADLGDEPRRTQGRLVLPVVTSEADGLADLVAGAYPNGGEVVIAVHAAQGGLRAANDLDRHERIEVVGITDLGADAPEGSFDPVAPEPPPQTYQRGIDAAAAAVSVFSGYVLEDNRVLESVRRKLDWARSTALWERTWSGALTYAEAVRSRLNGEADLIRPEGGNVRLTSQRGDVPVTVLNLASYPVRVHVLVSSTKLIFPDGAAKDITVPPRGETTIFVAEARSTGTFPMTIDVTSPDGRLRFGTAEVRVSSTGANTSAVVLTVGAAIFFAVWTIRRRLHRRRRT